MTDVPNTPKAFQFAPGASAHDKERARREADRRRQLAARTPHQTAITAAERMPIVFERDGEVFADSRDVAAYFGKEHFIVLRDIRTLITREPDLGQYNFVSFKIKDLTGETTSHYTMDEIGFTVLAFGFTGEKALKFKLEYIRAFHALKAEVRRLSDLRSTAIVPVAAPAFDLPAMLQDMTGLQNLVVGLLGRGAELERENAEKATLLAVQDKTITTHVLAIEDMRPRAAAGARFVELNGAVLSSRQGYSRHEYPLMPRLSGDILSRSTKNVEPRLAIPQGCAHHAHSIERVQAPYRARDLAIPRIARSQGCPLCGPR